MGFCIIEEIAFGSKLRPPIPEAPPPLIIPGNPPKPAIPPNGLEAGAELAPTELAVDPPDGAGASAFFYAAL